MGGTGGRVDILNTLMCRVSGNLEALTSWNPQGPHKDTLSFKCTQLICVLKISNNDGIHYCLCISDITNKVNHLKDHDGIYV
jgi:hypothetical protein